MLNNPPNNIPFVCTILLHLFQVVRIFLDCAFLVGATVLTFSLISITGVYFLTLFHWFRRLFRFFFCGVIWFTRSELVPLGVGGVGVSGSLGTSGVGGVGVSGSASFSAESVVLVFPAHLVPLVLVALVFPARSVLSRVGGIGVSGSLGTSGVGGVGGVVSSSIVC